MLGEAENEKLELLKKKEEKETRKSEIKDKNRKGEKRKRIE